MKKLIIVLGLVLVLGCSIDSEYPIKNTIDVSLLIGEWTYCNEYINPIILFFVDNKNMLLSNNKIIKYHISYDFVFVDFNDSIDGYVKRFKILFLSDDTLILRYSNNCDYTFNKI